MIYFYHIVSLIITIIYILVSASLIALILQTRQVTIAGLLIIISVLFFELVDKMNLFVF